MRVLVTGSGGMLGRNLLPELAKRNLNYSALSSSQVDLKEVASTLKHFQEFKPTHVVHLAARVGGIEANVLGGTTFFRENVEIDHAVFSAAIKTEVSNFIYMGSSCMYPSNLDRPMTEEDLWKGPLEQTNEAYALAKLMGTKYVESVSFTENVAWRTLIASNMYGPFDHFGSIRSHLIAAVIDRVYVAKQLGKPEIELWGDGTPRREFTYVGDVARFIAESLDSLKSFPQNLNIGIGEDHTIWTYYEKIARAIGYEGRVVPNPQKPNGTKRKLMDSTKAHSVGWEPLIGLDEGLELTLMSYLNGRAANETI